MKRILLLMVVAMLVAVMLAVTAGPALAAPPVQANKALIPAVELSEGHARESCFFCDPHRDPHT